MLAGCSQDFQHVEIHQKLRGKGMGAHMKISLVGYVHSVYLTSKKQNGSLCMAHQCRSVFVCDIENIHAILPGLTAPDSFALNLASRSLGDSSSRGRRGRSFGLCEGSQLICGVGQGPRIRASDHGLPVDGNLLAILEEHEGGHGGDAVRPRNILGVVDVDFGKCQSPWDAVLS